MALTIGLTYDLRSEYLAEGYTDEQVAEFDSDATVDALERAIRSLGYRTDRIGHARALVQRLTAGDRWDLVFNIAEGMTGRSREAQVPAILELYGVPYTGSDPLVCAATLDKAFAKRIVASAGLATPAFAVVRSPADVGAAEALRYPLFVKPLAEGTGKGIDGRSCIDSPRRLRTACADLLTRFAQPVLVEEYLPGREFTTGIVGTGAEARVVGTLEVGILPAEGREIYSLEMKEECETLVRYTSPPRDGLRADIEALALASYRTLECRDLGRVDVRLDAEGRPSFIEVNPLPGLHPHHSDLPMIATHEGMSYEALLGEVIGSALGRGTAAPAREVPKAKIPARKA